VRIAFFDPFSGASGDMVLGALLDVGLSLAALRTELGKLDIAGYELRAEPFDRGVIHGTRAIVVVDGDQPARDWSAIRALIEGSALDGPVKGAASAVFGRLAEAEAKVHGVSPDAVHFHEVGGVDAIVDICGACIGFALLGVEAIFSGPPRLGSGFAMTQHGLIPIPAPATAQLLVAAAAPTAGPDPGTEAVQAELLTPTGAAILTTLAQFRRPDFVPVAVGYGFGSRALPWPNALRLFLAEADPAAVNAAGDGTGGGDGDLVLATNIDDMNPQFYELLTERLFAAGALDVWLTPIAMKKGRPATEVSVLCAAARRAALEDVLFADSTTLGVRATRVERVKAARRQEVAVTRWGDVRLKLRAWNGRVLDAAPEYEDCLAIARARGVPLREVWNEAHRIGEVYVGRRLSAEGALPGRS
jgi:uncharacterized protein (TIGR00299 family) protein